MGLFDRLFRRRERKPATTEDNLLNLAFVLLSEPRPPDPEAIAAAFREFAGPEDVLEIEGGESVDPGGIQVSTLMLESGEKSFVALMPAPVPKGEADQGAEFSMSRFRNGWKLPPHSAHLVVTFHGAAGVSAIDRLCRFTSILAAVTKTSPAVGVYWGNAGATHDSEFFLSIAAEPEPAPKMMLWSGFSIAREEDGRFSLLSLGMEQLGLTDLMIVAGEDTVDSAIEWFYDLLFYIAQRGEALPEGDTIGRSADERRPVRYVRSPIEPGKTVCRVDLT